MEGALINVEDFIEILEAKNLVIVPRSLMEAQMVGNFTLVEYRRQVMAKKLISCFEISQAQLWGKITKNRVRQIVKNEVDPLEVVMVNKNVIKITRIAARNIALARGCANG